MRNLVRRMRNILNQLSRVQLRLRNTVSLFRSSERVAYSCEPATLIKGGTMLVCSDSSVWTLSAGKAFLNEPRVNDSHLPSYEFPFGEDPSFNGMNPGFFVPSATGR